MRFLLPGLFQREFGSEIQLEVEGEATLRDAVTRGSAQLCGIAFGGQSPSDEALLSRFLFFRKGRLVRLDDAVSNHCTIQVLLIATGG